MEFERRIAIVVAIDRYQDGLPALKTPVSDAQAVEEILRSHHGYETHLFCNQQATKSALVKTLEHELKAHVSKHDCVLFYFAGHGVALNGEDGPEGYLIPQDAKLGDVSTYLSMSKVHEALYQLVCPHFLGILDCCFAGTFRWSNYRDIGGAELGVIHQERYDRFIQDPAWQIITSAAHDQTALDAFSLQAQQRGQIGKHSPFAAALIEALQGKADAYPPSEAGRPAGDGVITATELYLYLRDRVEVATETHAIRQTPGIHPLKKHDKGEYIFLTPEHELNLPPAPPLNASKNPYRGLQPFETQHRALFFGRDELTKQLKAFIGNHSLTIVLGASGSGKSSLVKAGLIPQLQAEDQSERDTQWHVLSPIRPGEMPFLALNNALGQAQLPAVKLPTNSPTDTQGQQKSLAHSVAVWTKRNPRVRLLIFIDQSEELITLCTNEPERQQFFQQILTALNIHPDKLRVVLSLRSDFEPQIRDAGLKAMPDALNKVGQTVLKSHWQRGRFIVPAMTRAELREAIEKPAEARVMYFQPHDLVEHLVDEVADMPGALPLLSFALSELYLSYLQRQQRAQLKGKVIDRALTETDYNRLGGVIQSLTQRADQEYEALLEKDKAYAQTIRNVMLRMVVVGAELARRKVPEAELNYPKPENDRVQLVIEHFLSARLIVAGTDANNQTYYEPAHDALVKGWEKLLVWQKAEEEQVLLQRRLTPSATEWERYREKSSGNVPKGLARGKAVLDWLDKSLFAIEGRFTHLSNRVVQRWRSPLGQPTHSAQKTARFLWNANPYLDVLSEQLKSDSSRFNQVETEFVQQSIRQRRQNISWRWRLASAIALVITTTAIVASVQWISSQRRLMGTINALTEASQGLFDSNQAFDALLASLNAGKQRQQVAFGATPATEYQIKTRLQQAAFWVREKNRLEGHEAGVISVSISPDGQLLASGSADESIKIWDAATGEQTKTLAGHNGDVHLVAFSPDGKSLVSASASDSAVRLWDVATGEETATYWEYSSDSNGNKGASFSPDGKLLAYASSGNSIRVLDVATGNIERTLTGHTGGVNGIDFSPNGKWLASASFDGTVKLWNLTSGKPADTPFRHGTWAFAVSFSPDGKMLASGADGGQVKLWKLGKGNKPYELSSDFRNRVTNISFSPDGQQLIASGFDNEIKRWDVDTRKEIGPLAGHSAYVNSVSIHSDSRLLASASNDATIKIWDIGTRKDVNALLGHYSRVNSVGFSPDGRLLASASRDRFTQSDKSDIKLWNVEDKKLIGRLRGHNHWVEDVVFSPSGRILASSSWDKTARLWEVSSGKEISQLKGHSNWLTSVSFSPDEQLLATASNDRTIKLWDISNPQEPEEIATLEGHNNEAYQVSFSPDGRRLASASWDKTIKLWDISNPREPEEIATLEGHTRGVRSVSFSPDGKMLVSASDDATIKLWDAETYAEINTLSGHELIVRRVGFSPDGKMLVSASDDRTVRLWDVATHQEINVLSGHDSEVYSVSFSPDETGQLLASGSESGQLILWDQSEILSNFTLDKLLDRSCLWMGGYLANNPSVDSRDRHLCD